MYLWGMEGLFVMRQVPGWSLGSRLLCRALRWSEEEAVAGVNQGRRNGSGTVLGIYM